MSTSNRGREMQVKSDMFQSGWKPTSRRMMECIIWAKTKERINDALGIIYREYNPNGYGTRVVGNGPLWEISPELAEANKEQADWPAARITRWESV